MQLNQKCAYSGVVFLEACVCAMCSYIFYKWKKVIYIYYVVYRYIYVYIQQKYL